MISILSSLILILIIPSEHHSARALSIPGIGDIQTIANFASDAIGVLKGDLPISALLTGSTGPTLDKILDSIGDVSKSLDDFGDKFRTQLDAQAERFDERFDEINAKLDKLLLSLPLDAKATRLTRELHGYIIRVDNLYAKYERYSMGRDNFNNYTINKFIEAVTSDKLGDLDDTLSRIFSLLIPERSAGFTDGIFDILGMLMMKSNDAVCGTKITAQLQLYEIYESIMITETRGFIMSIFAYAMLSVFKRTSFNSELDFQRNQLVKRTEHYLKIVEKSMRKLPRNVELCDAHHYVEGIDYVKLQSVAAKNILRGHSIHLEPLIADIKNNMVISGIRFVHKKGIILECQIQQARLLPQAVIDRNYSWIKLDEIIVDESPRSSSGMRLDRFDYADRRRMDLVPYKAVETDSMKAMLMDDVVLPHGYVLAGVRIVVIKKDYFSLAIYGVKFDFKTGILDTKDTISIGPDPEYKGSDFQKRLVPGRKLPTEAKMNFVDSGPKDIFMMEPANGENPPIVPFFDARPVEMRSMSLALSGLGLYHRGAPGYGGYFNFRLLTIDLPEYLNY